MKVFNWSLSIHASGWIIKFNSKAHVVLKIKELTFVNDCFQNKCNADSGLYGQTLINHPFIDGNKRFGYVAMRLILLNYGLDIRANEDDKYYFVIDIAKGKLKFNEILEWVNDRLVEGSL